MTGFPEFRQSGTCRPTQYCNPPSIARYYIILALSAALCLAAGVSVGHAATTGGGAAMPWETPLQTIADSITGPVAKAIGVIAIAVTGLGFAFSEGGSALRKGLGIVFGLAIAFTASTFLTTFFAVTGGAVF